MVKVEWGTAAVRPPPSGRRRVTTTGYTPVQVPVPTQCRSRVGVPAAGAGEAVGSGSTETASERSPPDTGMAERATAWVWSRAVPVGAALRVCSNAERVFSTV